MNDIPKSEKKPQAFLADDLHKFVGKKAVLTSE